VRGLEQRRDPEALSLLVECLCDESWFLRDLAEQTFFRLGEEHAGPLVPLLSGGLWYTRLSGARLLGRLGYRPAVPALIDLGDDTNETVALAARDALLAVARQRGSARVAHALQRATPERRKRRIEEIAARDRALAKNLERLMADVDLMASDAPDRLIDPVESGEPAAAVPKPHRSFLSSKPFAAPRPAAAKPPPRRNRRGASSCRRYEVVGRDQARTVQVCRSRAGSRIETCRRDEIRSRCKACRPSLRRRRR
jgi:hypothetical protein